jgi:hypothetical protein
MMRLANYDARLSVLILRELRVRFVDVLILRGFAQKAPSSPEPDN